MQPSIVRLGREIAIALIATSIARPFGAVAHVARSPAQFLAECAIMSLWVSGMTESPDGDSGISPFFGFIGSPIGGGVVTALLTRNTCSISGFGQASSWSGFIWQDPPFGATFCSFTEVPTALGVGVTVTIIGWIATAIAGLTRKS